jgi:hypothetical protein
MTTITIVIQERDGKPVITWLEQQGDVLPQYKWDNFVAQTKNLLETD